MDSNLIKEKFNTHPFSKGLTDLEKDELIEEFITFSKNQSTTPFYSKDLPDTFNDFGKDIFCIFLLSYEFVSKELMAIGKETKKMNQNIFDLGSAIDFSKNNPNIKLDYQYQINKSLLD